ncbi:MAG TPA: hypothetical protein PKN95_12895 [Verrucomicrobiota bacterium]|nr:hypothetical protein [Verrucomicrobiota bacterium]HNT16118.1 hypothetical protein [Verrucomicrobiota bacterium]
MHEWNFRLRSAGLMTLLAICGAVEATGCNVPVFRYALERWDTDRYEAIWFCPDPLSPAQQAAFIALDNAGTSGRANVTITRADPTQAMPPDLRALWETQGPPAMPWMVVRYPRPSGIASPAWAGPLDPGQIASLLDSPLRKTLTQKLLSGDAIVWLLLESGDRRRDDAAARLVGTELRQLEKTLKLPELSPLDPPVNPQLPLKMAFSLVRLSRTDPAEPFLVAQLCNWNPQRTAAREPMLFPIFGRGRAIPPAIGDDIKPEAIREMAVFLTGPCSCEIKDLNPGFDLLLTADWNTMAGYQEVTLTTLPLVSMSQFATTAASTNALPPPPMIVVTNPPETAAPAVSVPAQTTPRSLLSRNLVVMLVVGLGFLAVTTIVLRTKAAGRTP